MNIVRSPSNSEIISYYKKNKKKRQDLLGCNEKKSFWDVKVRLSVKRSPVSAIQHEGGRILFCGWQHNRTTLLAGAREYAIRPLCTTRLSIGYGSKLKCLKTGSWWLSSPWPSKWSAKVTCSSQLWPLLGQTSDQVKL